jgi:hypothetical protein
MNACNYLAQETKTIFNTYQPVRTEASGIKDLATGIAGLTYSSLWRLIDSNDLGTGTPIATQAMQISGVMVAQGLIKLTIPIIISTGYLLSRHYP